MRIKEQATRLTPFFDHDDDDDDDDDKQNQVTDNTRHARHPLILNVAYSKCPATPPYRQHYFMYNLKYRIVSDKKKGKGVP